MKHPSHMFYALAATAFVALGYLFLPHTPVSAAATPGLHAVMATTSTITVGSTTNQTLFASDSLCQSRIITTVAQPIMLSFDTLGSTTLSGTVGHLQAASTTAVYDAALYGCGLMTAYGFNASTTITKSELQ